MRTLLTITFLACLATTLQADDNPAEAVRCFERIEHEVPVGDTITVFTVDGATTRYVCPVVMPGTSMLYVRSVAAPTGITRRIMIPADSIDGISYYKTTRIGTALGLAAGLTAGAMIAVALAPESACCLDFSAIPYAILGAFIGGVIGALGGEQLDKHLKVRVTLHCR